MKELTLEVSGMMCEGCENRVKNALSLIEGIEIIEVSHIKGIVKLNINENIEKNTILEAIADLGFDIVKED
ncbi:MAG: heavy-metal-associated domain-containing protein [Clostridia bacterium]|nr:heavy-metal-associated domain-containing protein [Clostridia bacterium]